MGKGTFFLKTGQYLKYTLLMVLQAKNIPSNTSPGLVAVTLA